MTSTPSLRNLKSPASERSNKSDTLEAESSVPALENDKKDERQHRKGKRAFTTFVSRYTTLLRAVELWGAVQADGPGRLAGDEEPPAVDGFALGHAAEFYQPLPAPTAAG